jgi:hypothetical protein
MAQDRPKGAIDRQIEESLGRYQQLIEDRQQISNQVQQSVDESRQITELLKQSTDESKGTR